MEPAKSVRAPYKKRKERVDPITRSCDSLGYMMVRSDIWEDLTERGGALIDKNDSATLKKIATEVLVKGKGTSQVGREYFLKFEVARNKLHNYLKDVNSKTYYRGVPPQKTFAPLEYLRKHADDFLEFRISCLKCGSKFLSDGRYNKVCGKCSGE